MKKILKIIGIILVIGIIIILYISYIVDSNTQETVSLTNRITKNYQTTEKIIYANEYNNNYIIKTSSQVIILSKDYKEIKKEPLSSLKDNIKNANLIYKTNKIMYEKVIRKNKKTIYEYYDALTGEQIKKTVLELQ